MESRGKGQYVQCTVHTRTPAHSDERQHMNTKCALLASHHPVCDVTYLSYPVSHQQQARREWVPPPRLEVALLDDGRSGRCAAPPPRVACYYALLQVSRDASDADIKHQYYRLARR